MNKFQDLLGDFFSSSEESSPGKIPPRPLAENSNVHRGFSCSDSAEQGGSNEGHMTYCEVRKVSKMERNPYLGSRSKFFDPFLILWPHLIESFEEYQNSGKKVDQLDYLFSEHLVLEFRVPNEIFTKLL